MMDNHSLCQILAQRAAISRRAAAELIKAAQVTVRGEICTNLTQQFPPSVSLTVSGKELLGGVANPQLLLYHKPVGEICSAKNSATHKDTRRVFDALPEPDEGKWIMVGRLDINTSGLLLFTTDGELAYRLMHPKYMLDREYIARVKSLRSGVRVTPGLLQQLKQGVQLDGKLAKFNDIVPLQQSKSVNQYFYVVVQEGRNRLVRRLWEKFGFRVSRLLRVRFANLHLPQELRPGDYMLLNKTDRRRLAACVGL